MSTIVHPSPPEKSVWANKSIDERQKWAEAFYINHPDAKQILADFIQKMAYCVRATTHSAMLVIGESGSGKTTLTNRMKQIAIALYGREDEEKTICPVIQFAVPNPCTPYELSVSVLTALGDPNPQGRKSRSQTMTAAENLLRQCEVRLVLIDNFHDIPARRAARGIELVGTRLRELIDSSAALWVFLGTAASQKVVDSDTQLIKRISYRARLRYFDLGSPQSRKVFAHLLAKVDSWLPLAEPSCISDISNAWMMQLASEGIFDRIFHLVDHGWFLAVSAGRETMLLEDLTGAFIHVHGAQRNEDIPFHPDFVKRRLINPGDPYEIFRGEE